LRFASASESKGGNLDADSLPQKQINDTGINFQAKGNQGNLKAPSFNGKVIYPVKAFLAGLSKQEPVAAVYAILNSEYKRGKSDGWDQSVVYVGVTRNLHSSLTEHLEKHGSQTVANVRALSFTFPQLETMRDTASSWRELIHQSTGERYLKATTLPTPLDELNLLGIADFISNSSEDEDEDDDDWANEMDDFVPQRSESINPIISPFIRKDLGSLTPKSDALSLTRENVDKILEEVRPYLISDGGNVSVRRVDEGNGDVYLKLEGACGSCSSSTITMKMGIERILKETFPMLGEVIQVTNDDEDDAAASKIDSMYSAVKVEVDRLLPAIEAMGGSVEIVKVDSTQGLVELNFCGASRVKTGLELALRDIPSVKDVKFLS